MPTTQHILIADTEALTRFSLQQVLKELGRNSAMEVVTCARLQQELGKKIYTHLITELYLADGSVLEILSNVRSLYPTLRILFLSTMSKAILNRAMKTYHIQGYISKEAPEKEIIANLILFLKNQPHTFRKDDSFTDNLFEGIAPREMEVLHYILKGYRTAEIARNLNRSRSTISTIKSRLFKKTKTKNLSELIALARRYNIH